MLVKRCMQRDLITIEPDASLRRARRIMQNERIRHLPVVAGGRLIGILTDRDIRTASPSSASGLRPAEEAEFLDRLLVADVMVRRVITIDPEAPLEEAASLMQHHRIGCLPVQEEGRLVGLITDTDVLRVLVAVLGVAGPSSRLELILPDGPGALSLVEAVAERQGAPVLSLVTAPPAPTGGRRVIVRVGTVNPNPIRRELEAAGCRVVPPFE